MILRSALAAVVLVTGLAAMVGADAPDRVLARNADAPLRAADPPPAPGAAPDSTFDGFLDEMADSTTRYFGVSAVRPDTAGFDSALAHGIANPPETRGQLRPSFSPDFRFSRVDGPVYTLAAGLGQPRTFGQFRAEASYASGPNDVLWKARWTKAFGGRTAPWWIQASGGLETESMDRERASVRLASARAFLIGKDSHHYLRQRGWELGLRRELSFAELGVSYRDMEESPIATSAGWNLFHFHLSPFDNLAARSGRVHEFEYAMNVHVDPFPVELEVIHQTSGNAIGSDFEYRRTRFAASGDLGLGSWATFVPQVVYGRLSGEAVPQASFYLGGSRSIRSLKSGSRGGTGYALGRLEMIGATDILETLHIPHPAFLPLQLGVFTAAGAVWGVDPYGGPIREGTDWPRSGDWVSEAGVSLIYQPGIPDPTTLLRVNYAVALGPARESSKFSISFSHAMDFLRRFRG